MHHVLCTLLTSKHEWLQSASVAFLPALPLPSSWSVNRRSKSWSATRKQRATPSLGVWAAGTREGDGAGTSAWPQPPWSSHADPSAPFEQSSYSSQVPFSVALNS